MTLKLPASVTVVLAAIMGVLTGLSQTSFGFDEPWKVGVGIALGVLALWGISPLTGVAFKAILHISPTVANLVTAAVVAGQLIITQVSITGTAKGIIAGVLSLIAGLGFAPSIGVALAGKMGYFRPGTKAAR